MKRRCEFLDCLPAFNYNNGYGEYDDERTISKTTQLGSTLMNAMLDEVRNLCDPTIKENWSLLKTQPQVDDSKMYGLMHVLTAPPSS